MVSGQLAGIDQSEVNGNVLTICAALLSHLFGFLRLSVILKKLHVRAAFMSIERACHVYVYLQLDVDV